MPIYEYRCDVCGHTFEVFQKFSDKPVETCEVCGGHVAKVLHPVAIHFKGSGFYTTDYGRGVGKTRPAPGETSATTDGDAPAKASEPSGAKAAGSNGKDGGSASGGGQPSPAT